MKCYIIELHLLCIIHSQLGYLSLVYILMICNYFSYALFLFLYMFGVFFFLDRAQRFAFDQDKFMQQNAKVMNSMCITHNIMFAGFACFLLLLLLAFAIRFFVFDV